MAFPSSYHHGDSDADDEYERSIVVSPRLADDSEASPTDSEPPSTENTPTAFANMPDDRTSPTSSITEWSAEECANFASSLGLKQYRDSFIENEIVGEALIALRHDELKELGISSVGHRLTLLKSVYEIKVKQGVPFDSDHYVPLSAEQSNAKEVATQEDVALLIRTIRKRDERLAAAEAELRKLADDYRRLREELLPVFKMAKDRSQPLPYQPTSSFGGSTLLSDQCIHDQPATSPSINQPEKTGTSLSRSFSKKLFAGGTTPKTSSPTHIPQSIPEGRTYTDTSTLDPSAAAMAASSHLTASMNGGQPSPKGIPSPTSPASFYPQQTLASRSYSRETSSINRSYDHPEDPQSQQRQDRPTPNHPNSNSNPPSSRNPNDAAGPSVEIFKSFRVSMDDPCYKVLPAALKKYNIHEDWRHYALYIVYGDQERCLGLEEKPLILFKQLAGDGQKPMFMLRRQTPISDSTATNIYPGGGIGIPPGSAGIEGGGGGIGRPQPGAIQLPGGVL
ncbi:protein kinase regulator Ste50 [Coccidioides immitis RS]|uniref:Protein kinase regulator Ste50 n=6 Tax=Coccidioides TaxID=5500 RepID=J3K2A5_COCIM|nr:protein kinase regulator Ste50 [Coccidioides immitis RS]XP_003067326.1 Ste50p, putative [Coccidioides posadasii C735 delta SOWgp]EFW19584.1 protein kinase regulator Ste50 [Coccidioides posadasii str. Silveira]KMM72042.1 Ste50p [Coccidioides posadasii RMSCC 3488]KMP09035.1 Ste50p [Coccidioides immitis RMSCC 2394]KMU77955.1 Ste50p [Coccidioides immitis RMSCC 3703]EAS28206.3 protein kinase regulator Ste50 [Coccidioides immitis RS]|eukprot:XP_003067326.1 Ste50p, putative [Coccidioides posadasii C735 delta SOWgp]